MGTEADQGQKNRRKVKIKKNMRKTETTER